MSRHLIDRRQFLTLPLALLLAPLTAVHAEIQSRRALYEVDAGILWDLITLHLKGTLEETVDPEAGRYEVKIAGQGAGLANRVESVGTLRGGRWAPLRTTSWFQVRGRESRSEIAYDYRKGAIEYHFRGETFFLRRLRVAEDLVPIPEGMHVDDVISATLNHAERRWAAQGDGTLRTTVIRRKRNPREGPDDVEKLYRAELIPVVLRPAPDASGEKAIALCDLTPFSSWARPDLPARIVFGPDRRPESVSSSLMLGTSVAIRFRAV